ncbi:MAG TPA: hypothetical protein VFK69_05645 [Candidatus Eisenbacteria bacterium]|nr:hypothetical protein [Candidatus Eisenbacteria bacterium]
MSETRRIPVRSAADVWTFTQRMVPLWDILEFFPADAVGPRAPDEPPPAGHVTPITIETDLGFAFETDIQFGAWRFRPAGLKQPGMLRWCRERGLEPGDAIVFERLGERRYALRLEKAGAAPAPPGG